MLRKAANLNDLNPNLAAALVRMHTNIVLVDGGAQTHKIHERTILALLGRRLIEEARDKRARPVYKPTTYGLEVIRAEVPRFLAAKAQKGYVSDPRLGMFNEPEAVDDVWLDKFAEEAAGSEVSRLSERSIAWECESALQAAAAAGVDVTRERLAIQRRIRAIQRKAEQRAA